MAAAGVRLLGGSDCPVERPDPLVGVAAAVLRPGWDDDEHLTLPQALDLFTAAPRAHFGRPAALAPGAPADFVIVEGGLGAAGAVVVSNYRAGRRIEPAPLAWPG
jgi:predicted amidohydrolase YtcJ